MNQTVHLRLAIAASIALGLSACGFIDENKPASAPNVAHTDNGDVKGIDRLGMRSYFAIPFAAPPVGALRWAAPAPAAKWSATLENNHSASPCLQSSASPFRLSGDSEDCLYLDVHAPVGAGPYPVMVHLHGGNFNTGGTASFADPSPLVSKGVIVVNVAYRLGAMGFLAHPALAVNGAAGNYGIMDQQAGLKWVQDNIVRFAGDRNNITVFGESAGGFSVMTHLAASGSKGLFNKALVQSGNYGNDRQLSGAQMAAASSTIVDAAINAATTAGIGGIDCTPVTATCLRNLPDTVVRRYLADAMVGNIPNMVPSVDGKVLTRSVKATFLAGDNVKVPMVNGTTENEYALYIAINESVRRAAATPPNLDPANTSFSLSAAAYAPTVSSLTAGSGANVNEIVNRFYPLASYGANAAIQPSLAVAAMATDLGFSCPALRTAQRVNTQATPVWLYEFRDQSAPPTVGVVNGKYTLSFQQGAAHLDDMQYLYRLSDLANDEQRQLQTAMTRYWTNFAKTGNPNTGGEVAANWPAFTGPTTVLALDVASAGGITQLSSFDADHKCSQAWGIVTF